MKNFSSRLLFAFLCFATAGCAAMHSSPRQTVMAARTLDQQFADAFSRGDLDAIMATYAKTEDVVLYPPDEVEVRGWENIRQSFKKAFAERPGARLELTSSHYRAAGGLVFGWGTWRMTFPAGPSKVMQMDGRYSEIQANRNGKMVYLVDHASAPFAPMPESIHVPRKTKAAKKSAAKTHKAATHGKTAAAHKKLKKSAKSHS